MYFCYRYNNKYQKQNKINILIGTPHTTKTQICSILITLEILTEYLFEYYNNDTKIFVRYPDSHLTGLLSIKMQQNSPITFLIAKSKSPHTWIAILMESIVWLRSACN